MILIINNYSDMYIPRYTSLAADNAHSLPLLRSTLSEICTSVVLVPYLVMDRLSTPCLDLNEIKGPRLCSGLYTLSNHKPIINQPLVACLLEHCMERLFIQTASVLFRQSERCSITSMRLFIPETANHGRPGKVWNHRQS